MSGRRVRNAKGQKWYFPEIFRIYEFRRRYRLPWASTGFRRRVKVPPGGYDAQIVPPIMLSIK